MLGKNSEFLYHSTLLDSKIVTLLPKQISLKFKILLLHIHVNRIEIAVTDPISRTDTALNSYLNEKFGKIDIIYFNMLQEDFHEAVEFYYDFPKDLKDLENKLNSETILNQKIKIISVLNLIILQAIKESASDIHFSRYQDYVRVRYRIDGYLVNLASFPLSIWSALLVRLKVMANLNIGMCLEPIDGRFSLTVTQQHIDFRLSIHPTINGENLVIRILNKTHGIMPLEQIGFTEDQLKKLLDVLKVPEGLIIVTGPTGSGKTTTLYSILSYLNSDSVNIMTLEQPVEYFMEGIQQSEIKENVGMTFGDGIRSILRQDPNIILIGEIRDKDTAMMTIRASMTGHQVFATLHTNDVYGVPERLQELEVSKFNIHHYLKVVIAQRLVRKNCRRCQIEFIPSQQELFLLELPDNVLLVKGAGCEECSFTGFKGRIPLIDILFSDKLQSIDLDHCVPLYERKEGLWQQGKRCILNAETTLDEILKTLNDII